MEVSKRFRVPIYNDLVIVRVVDDMNHVDEKDHLETSAYVLQTKAGIEIVFHKDKTDLGIVVHEVVHLVNHIFANHYVRLDAENDEHQAYFTEYLFNKVLEIYNKIKI